MTTAVMGLASVGVLFGLLFARLPVWLALALIGIVGNIILSNVTVAQFIAGSTTFDMASKYGLSVIPMFILMGEIATESRLSATLFSSARIVLSGLRGALSVATIAASGAFGAISGSSVATAATMTRIALPEMRKANYKDGYSAASIAAGGTLGILIPPSIILIIYGAIAELSVPRLFAASLIPGILLLFLYVAVSLVLAGSNSGSQLSSDHPSFAERVKAALKMWQFAILFLVTIGGIYAGVFSPNEAAGIGSFAAMVLGFADGRLNVSGLLRSLRATAITTAALFMIVIGATMFANFVVQTRLPNLLIAATETLSLAPLTVMTIIILVYLILGCFLEGIGMVLITVPVFLPVATGFGYDPLWFGIIVVIVVELGLITPPVGMNIFIIQAQAPDINLVQLYKGIGPFLIAPIILIILLFLFPQIALWLPDKIY
ncbi:MAG: TRAP transporter large permease [Rhizobiaceae bacterium]